MVSGTKRKALPDLRVAANLRALSREGIVVIPDRYQGRARSKGYVPPPRKWTSEQRIAELERIAGRAERGEATPLDELEASAHMAALSAANSQSRPEES